MTHEKDLTLCDPNSVAGRNNLDEQGRLEADDYFRDYGVVGAQDLQRIADQAFANWMKYNLDRNPSNYQKQPITWDKDEARLLFTQAFIRNYTQKMDERSSQGQLPTLPAIPLSTLPATSPPTLPAIPVATPPPTLLPTLSNTATLQGARLTVVGVERKADEYVYSIELADPGYIDGIQTAEIVYSLSEEKPPEAGSGHSYANTGSDVVPSYQSSDAPSPAPQKGTGLHLYLRNVKKK